MLTEQIDPIVLIDRTHRAEDKDEGPIAFGFDSLVSAFETKGIPLVFHRHLAPVNGGMAVATGLTSDQMIQRLLSQVGQHVPGDPEGVVFQWSQTAEGPLLVAAGSDERGLMYALLELADAIHAEGLAAFDRVQNQVVFPDQRVRGVDRFIMGPLDDDWFYADEFWAYYLARLARCRFNRLVLVTGFDTAYLSPPYPYFVSVPGYEDVHVADLDERGRQRNLDRLQRIGRACRQHGLAFIFGTWQQTPWTENQKRLVEGLPTDEEELADYCARGLKRLLQACPEIDGAHFRVNFEAGMGTQESNEAFWLRLIDAVADCGRRVKLDLRAKGLTDGMIQYALDRGLEVAVPTKYWCEQTGLPHHLTQMRDEELAQLDNLNHSRRYSYSDLLRKPRWYDLLYRLWTLGSTTLFLWGDPDYVRRFSASCRLGAAAGFEVAAPLSLKGGHAAIQGEPWPIFADPELRVGRWEDERYWLYYLLWGRIGYSGETDAWVWQRELRARWGDEAAASLERAIRTASRILPLVTAFHMPVHPMLNYWPELTTGAALFAEHNHNRRYNGGYYGDVSYGSAEPSDPGLFYAIDVYAQDRARGDIAGKYTPHQVASWLAGFADEVRSAVAESDKTLAENHGAEYRAARLDLLMLADLATYHARKIRAALALAFFRNQQGEDHLRAALRWATAAREAWIGLAQRGRGSHHDPLEFSAGHSRAKSGQWADRIPELDADVAKLTEMVEQMQGDTRSVQSAPGEADSLARPEPLLAWPVLDADVPTTWPAGKDLAIEVRIAAVDRFAHGLTLHYRHANQLEGPFRKTRMVAMDGGFRAVVPGEYLRPEWDLLVYVSAVLSPEAVLVYPGLYSPVNPLPYFVVEVGPSS